VAMAFMERLAMRLVLTVKFGELYENVFETFFHDLMSFRYEDFGDVRTAGRRQPRRHGKATGTRSTTESSTPATYLKYSIRGKLKEKFDCDLAKDKAKAGWTV
jgi:hypothetical protein